MRRIMNSSFNWEIIFGWEMGWNSEKKMIEGQVSLHTMSEEQLPLDLVLVLVLVAIGVHCLLCVSIRIVVDLSCPLHIYFSWLSPESKYEIQSFSVISIKGLRLAGLCIRACPATARIEAPSLPSFASRKFEFPLH